MKTNDLINLLAAQAGPAEDPISPQRCLAALLPALLISLLSAFLYWGFVPMSFFEQAGPWLKILLGTSLLLICRTAYVRAGQPGSVNPNALLYATGVFTTVTALGLGQFALSDETSRSALLWGHSWSGCPRNILVLSLPMLTALLFLMRRMAPTRLATAGAYAGLLAGSMSAIVYALSCTETAFLFIAVWYGLGILLTTATGAILGRFILNW